MTVTNHPKKKTNLLNLKKSGRGRRQCATEEERRGRWQCRAEARTWALPDAVRATKKSSTPVASGTTAEKGAADKNIKTSNRNLSQGKESDDVHTDTYYFDPVWNSFSKHTDGSMQWIPKLTKFVGKDTTRKTTPGSPSRIYRDMLPW